MLVRDQRQVVERRGLPDGRRAGTGTAIGVGRRLEGDQRCRDGGVDQRLAEGPGRPARCLTRGRRGHRGRRGRRSSGVRQHGAATGTAADRGRSGTGTLAVELGANPHRRAGCERAIPAFVADRHGVSRLAPGTVPALGELLTARVGVAQRPGTDSRGAARDLDRGREPARPLFADAVRGRTCRAGHGAAHRRCGRRSAAGHGRGRQHHHGSRGDDQARATAPDPAGDRSEHKTPLGSSCAAMVARIRCGRLPVHISATRYTS